MNTLREFYDLVDEMNLNHDCFVVTILDGEAAGAKAVLYAGSLCFTSGEDMFFRRNLEQLNAIRETGIHTLEDRRLYAERLGKEKQVVVCGAGHVGAAITRTAKFIGLRVTAIDDRPVFADAAREAGADQVICDSFEEALSGIPGGGDTYFVIVTRGHKWDEDCLRMIASEGRRRQKLIYYVIRSKYRSIFFKTLQKLVDTVLDRYMDQKQSAEHISAESRKIITRFYRSIFMGQIMDWIESGMEYDLIAFTTKAMNLVFGADVKKPL